MIHTLQKGLDQYQKGEGHPRKNGYSCSRELESRTEEKLGTLERSDDKREGEDGGKALLQKKRGEMET